jgi:hypothetical protein
VTLFVRIADIPAHTQRRDLIVNGLIFPLEGFARPDGLLTNLRLGTPCSKPFAKRDLLVRTSRSQAWEFGVERGLFGR